MATNQTEHYKLNQWELTDSVVMEEFNSDNAKIEQALLELKASLPKFQSGTFTITKSPTKDAPLSLTFDFSPQLVVIIQEDDLSATFGPVLLLRGVTQHAYLMEPANDVHYKSDILSSTWEDNTLTLYTDYYAMPTATYHYLAIG